MRYGNNNDYSINSLNCGEKCFYFEGGSVSAPASSRRLLSVFSFLCALDRLQLGVEVHAPLNRPHLHLSIDGEQQTDGG